MKPSRRAVVRYSVAAAACSVLLAAPSIPAIAAPSSDDSGYVDSTARCASPATAVLFGSTDTSRVAICKLSDGSYEYRGVRVRDGARLVADATTSGDGTFTVKSNGIEYMVTSKTLTVSSGSTVIRDESWVDFHGAGGGGAAATAPAPTSVPAPTSTSLPPGPRLPAEVGGG